MPLLSTIKPKVSTTTTTGMKATTDSGTGSTSVIAPSKTTVPVKTTAPVVTAKQAASVESRLDAAETKDTTQLKYNTVTEAKRAADAQVAAENAGNAIELAKQQQTQGVLNGVPRIVSPTGDLGTKQFITPVNTPVNPELTSGGGRAFGGTQSPTIGTPITGTPAIDNDLSKFQPTQGIMTNTGNGIPVVPGSRAGAVDSGSEAANKMMYEQQAAKDQAVMDKAAADKAAADKLAQDEANRLANQGTGGGGGGVSTSKTSTSTTTGTGTSTPGAGTVTPGNTATNDNPYFAQVENMRFEWNSATDPEYMQEASNLENTVAQMMVGRGGLYSSITNSALQSRLTTLQATFRKEKYAEFLAERNFLMTQASFLANRQDAAFSQKMQTLNYQLSLENQKFNQQMQRSQLAISQANAATAKAAAAASTKLASSKAYVYTQAAAYSVNKSSYDKYAAEWAQSGTASKEVAAYFGVMPKAIYFKNQTVLDKKEAELAAQYKSISQMAYDNNEYELLLASANNFASNGQSTADTTATDMNTNYDKTKTYLLMNVNSKAEADAKYNEIVKGKAGLVAVMGITNWQKLVADAKYLQSTYSPGMVQFTV